MSTAKSMANNYKRAQSGAKSQQFKSSASNLASSNANNSSSAERLKATSMTNLMSPNDASNQNGSNPQVGNRLQRPASRSALDSIHNGMNAKYAQVQSKVAMSINKSSTSGALSVQTHQPSIKHQNRASTLRAASSRSNLRSPTGHMIYGKTTSGLSATAADRQAKIKQLEDDLSKLEQERNELKSDLEREKADKLEQISKIKQELEEKLAEHDKQGEDYHQKLLEAYELADQNRRTADAALAESRQRDTESQKKITELESQLNELKEFVSMKEEMTGKMYELREQLREERERYEEQLKSLHQVFENEKISGLRSTDSNSSQQKERTLNTLSSGNSNYFNRIKPSLQSTESINQIPSSVGGECRKCRSGESKLHRSEHDMYGSKLSTRMQTTAKSAWKASKNFANSVITGGVSLNSCRKFSKQQQQKKTKSSPMNPKSSDEDATNKFEENNDTCNYESSSRQDLHTSIVEVHANAASPHEPSIVSEQLASSNRLIKTPNSGERLAGSNKQSPQMIHVDRNNKLTIVTKFSDDFVSANSASQIGSKSSPSGASQASSSNAPSDTLGTTSGIASASSNSSERSRCESSSSGRGTSDAGSTSASQNGDLDQGGCVQSDTFDENNTIKDGADINELAKGTGHDFGVANTDMAARSEIKRHKRKSSLFKASKVFGGSQASLSKLKSLFVPTSGKMAPAKGIKRQLQTDSIQQQPQTGALNELQHIEASRLRCMKLNEIKQEQVASTESSRNAISELEVSSTKVSQGKVDENSKEIGEDDKQLACQSKCPNDSAADLSATSVVAVAATCH